MVQLPVEIWVQILDYLSPTDLLAVQRTSRQLLKISRDASIWRSKCFEEAPSAVHAFSNGDSLTDLLNGLSLTSEARESQPPSRQRNGESSPHVSRRARAIANWDCTNPGERIDWYSEYIARTAPLTTEWLDHPRANEIRGMSLFENDRKVLSPMEDGSLRIWDVRTATSGRRSLHECAKSQPGLLFDDLRSMSGTSSSKKEGNTGSAVDSTVVGHSHDKAYVAVDDVLNEVDLNTMSVVSQSRYAWKITAISQQSSKDLPLMIGTSFSLQMHDPRISLNHRTDNSDSKLDLVKEEENTIFLPNYSKDWAKGQSRERQSRYMRPAGKFDLDAWAPVEPGPQTILHRGPNEIIVAGRMPSILFYDKRTFPQLQSVIHSGARLASLATIPHPPHGASSFSTNTAADATLIAAGEYHGRGSLELYELPHHRLSDSTPSYSTGEEYITPSLSRQNDIEPTDLPQTPTPELQPPQVTTEPYSYKNRQSSSSAKLLSVATQGTRIVYSDTEGKLHWVERDGRGLARRWNINSYAYNHAGGAVVGEAVARKILTFNSDNAGQDDTTRGDGDLLIWTGWDLAVVTSKVKWTGHDELVEAFEEKMSLEDAKGEGPATNGRRSSSSSRSQEMEEEYARTMRRALERQADERRFLARFGRMR